MPLEINLGQPALAPVNVDRVTLRNALSSEIAGASQVNRGWQSADLNESAGKLMWKANRAESVGDLEGAAVFEQQGRDLMRQGQQWAPTVQNFTDINGAGSAVDWAGGALGNVRSSIKPALGGLAGAAVGAVAAPFTGGVINPLLGARVGAGLAGYNTMTESNVADMMMDERIRANRSAAEIANAARGAGAVQGALESIVPAGVAGSVVGLGGRKAAAEIAKNGLLKTAGKRVGIDAAEEFATEFAQNPVGDIAKNYLKGDALGNVDWQAALNAGAAGAVGGGGMGAVGAGADALHAGLGKGVDKAREIKNDPVGTILDAGVDLAAKAGTAKAKLENYFDERELKAKDLTQDEIDQGRLEQIQKTLAGKSDLTSTSPFTEEETAMDAPTFNAHHEGKLKADAATILKAGRDSTDAEKSLAAEYVGGKIDAVEFQTRLHQVQNDKVAEKETDALLTGLGQKSKKSMMKPGSWSGENENQTDVDAGRGVLPKDDMTPSDRMYLESELLKPDNEKKINTLADIMVKQGVDERLIKATNGEHNKIQLAGMLNWIKGGMQDHQEAVGAIVGRFGEGSAAMFKKAYGLATRNGIVKDEPKVANDIEALIKFASNKEQIVKSALKNNLSDIALHGVQDVDAAVAKLVPMMKTLVQEGMSPKVKQGLIDNFFGTEERLHNVMNAYIDTGEHKKKVSKATGGGKEEVEIDADGNVVAPEQFDEDGELIVDKFGAGASVSEVKGPTIVGFTNPKGRVGVPFNLGFDKGIEKFEKVKAQHDSEMGNSVAVAGIWSRTKSDLGNDDAAIEQAGYDLLESFGPKLMPEGKYASLIKGFSEGTIDIGDLSPRQRAVLLGRINRQFKYLEVTKPDSGDSKHNVQDVESFKWNPKDAKPSTFTAQQGIIFLERQMPGKDASGFPVKTVALLKQGLLTEKDGTNGATLEGKRRGALGTSDLVVSGLTDLMLAEGGNFTGRIGYRLKAGGDLQWIEKAERGGNVKLELLPDELTLGMYFDVGDAKEQADIERREEKSTDASINFAENHKERVEALLELAQRESTSPKFAFMIHARMKKGAPAILQLYRELRDQWQGSPDGFGGTPMSMKLENVQKAKGSPDGVARVGEVVTAKVYDTEKTTEMRRKGQKEGVPAPSEAQGRIEAEDGDAEVNRGYDGQRVGLGADAMGAGYEGPASTRSRQGTKADPARKVKREGGDQIAARDWVVGLLQKGIPAFNAAMRKVETDADTKARVEVGLNTLMSMSEQGVAEQILGDKTKLQEAATIIARAKEVQGDEFVIRNASGKTEVRRHGDAVAGRGAEEGRTERDQLGEATGPDVGTDSQTGASGNQAGRDSGLDAKADGASGNDGRVGQDQAGRKDGPKNGAVVRQSQGQDGSVLEQLQAYLDQHGSKNAPWAGAARKAIAENKVSQITGALAAAKRQFGETKVATGVQPDFADDRKGRTISKTSSQRLTEDAASRVAEFNKLSKEEQDAQLGGATAASDKVLDGLIDELNGEISKWRETIDRGVAGLTHMTNPAALIKRLAEQVADAKKQIAKLEGMHGTAPDEANALPLLKTLENSNLHKSAGHEAAFKTLKSDHPVIFAEAGITGYGSLIYGIAVNKIKAVRVRIEKALGVKALDERTEALIKSGVSEVTASKIANIESEIAGINQSMAGRPETGPDAEAAVGAKQRKIAQLQAELGKLNTKQSTQRPTANPKNKLHEQVAAAEAHILKTIGSKIEVLFQHMSGGSGEWAEGVHQNTIKLALNGDVLGAAFHESFHEFMDILRKNAATKTADVLQRAAMNPMIQRKLERLLDGHPEAIAQLKDPEEAAAFMYQFWSAGLLKIGPETRTAFDTVKNFLKKVAGFFSETFRSEVESMTREQLEAGHAELLLRQFSEGAVANMDTRQMVVEAMEKNTEVHNAAVERVGSTFNAFANGVGKLVFSSEAMMEATGNKHMVEIMRGMHQKVGTAMRQFGRSHGAYSDGLRQNTSHWMHKVEAALAGYSKEDLELARAALSQEKEPTDRVAKEIVAKINTFYGEMAQYMKTKGVKRLNMDRIDPVTNMKGVWEDIPLRKNYLSQVWSIDKLMESLPEFKADLLKHHMKELEALAVEANKELKDMKGIKAGTAAGIELDRADKEFKDSGKVMAKMNLQTITPEMIADAIGTRLLASHGHIEISESTSGMGITPAASAVNKRELNWLDKEVFDKYKEKDLTNILTTYAHSIVKRGEFQSRFGPAGEVIAEGADKAVLFELGGDALVDKAVGKLPAAKKAWAKAKAENGEAFDEPFPTIRSVGQNMHAAQVGQEKHDAALLKTMKKLQNGFNTIQALEGTLGRDITPGARALNSWLVTYQSFRTLSTMLFTSFQDVAGIVVNGGEAGDAWNAFVEGIREIRNTVFDNKDPSQRMKDAEFWGTVDAGAFLETSSQAHGSPFMSGKAKQWSDTFFKYTGAVGWNRGVRSVATQVAERIITGWKTEGIDRNDKAAVSRLEDLFGKGFDPANIKLTAEGRLDPSDAANQAAVTRWVLTAVPAPTAAHRTIWMSDPHYAVFAQLKNYTYSFHRIMMKNAADQARLGNYRPVLAMLLGYTPIAIAAGAIKEMLIPGDEPPWMKGGLDGYLSYGFARAGVLGVPQMLLGSVLDASQLPGGNFGKAGSAFDPASLAGPTADQVQNILSIPFGEFMAMKDHTVIGEGLGALPGGNLVKRLERLGST